jgi:hypothetical protein
MRRPSTRRSSSSWNGLNAPRRRAAIQHLRHGGISTHLLYKPIQPG